jgi:hypothetical protein
MTRKDFTLIAETIAARIERENGNTTKAAECRREAARDMAYAFAAKLRATNPRFDERRFLAAAIPA